MLTLEELLSYCQDITCHSIMFDLLLVGVERGSSVDISDVYLLVMSRVLEGIRANDRDGSGPWVDI